MANIYVSSASYNSVTAWTTLMTGDSTANGGRGTYVRATAPAAGSERVFRCTSSGTAGVSEPGWVTTHHQPTTDGTITWTECTGDEAEQVAGTLKAPHKLLGNAFAAGWSTTGDTIFVGASHSTTQSSALTLTAPGTAASPNRVLCILEAPSAIPPVSADLTTGAAIATTGASNITFAGVVSECNGITFTAGDSSNLARIVGVNWSFKNCALVLGGTSGSNYIQLPNSVSGHIELNNTTVQVAAAGQSLYPSGDFLWTNTLNAIAGATLPTSLFAQASSSRARLRGVDLHALSGKNLVASNLNIGLFLEMTDCYIPSSFTFLPSQSAPGVEVIATRTNPGAVNYDQRKYDYWGSQIPETTVTRSGGATDLTQAISWNITTTANTSWGLPFTSLPIIKWNDTAAGNVTVTVYGIWGGGAVPKNDDIWIEVEYLGNASYPQATFATTTKANTLAGNADCTTDGVSSWGGSTTAFKMVALLDTTHNPQPGMKGPISVRIKAAKATSTFYIDPDVVLS